MTMQKGIPQSRRRGFTVTELLLSVAVLMVLASVAVPTMRWHDKRRREARLKIQLQLMRSAIDQYHQYFEEGLIVQEDVEQMGYPLELEDLVEGVEVGDPESPELRIVRFLPRIPTDPFTGEAEWGRRSYQDEWDSRSWGGENVYDVYSLSRAQALDETYYSEW